MAEKAGKKRRLSRFYVIYFSCLAAAFLALFLALRFVRVLLAEYEAAQPKYVAQEVFARYFDPIDYPELLAFAQYDAGMAGDAAVTEYLTEAIGDSELSIAPGSAADEDTMRYLVRAGRVQVAAINLRKDDAKTAHGFARWRFANLELSLDNAPLPGRYLTITAPAGATVTVDGTVLGEADITERYVNTTALPAFPSGIEGLDYVVYTLRGATALPGQVTVSDAAGNQAAVTYDDTAHAYTAGPVYSAALADEYSGMVTKAVQGYAGYMQNVPGTSFEAIRGYFDPDAPLYKAIRAAAGDMWMVFKSDSSSFEDEYIGEFCPLGEDVFSCHISFTQVLHRGGTDRPDAVDMTVFLHKTDNGYRIFEWSTNT